jgi:nucleotide-binding universal stress UspA family protein
MKKMLVPVDFSDNSLKALDFAIPLANRFLAEITLYHGFSKSRSEKIEEYVQRNAEEEIEALVNEIRPSLREGAAIIGAAVMGDPVSAIAERMEKHHYDLIIMGTQGEAGIKGFLMGSVTLEVIRKVQTPVLAIPREAAYRPVKTAVFALDDMGLDFPNTLQPLRNIVYTFEGTIKVYHQVERATTAIPNLLVDSALEGVHHSFHQEVSEEEIWSGILQYAQEQEADLLCLIRRERGFFGGLFHQSVTREELTASSIPMLILYDKE